MTVSGGVRLSSLSQKPEATTNQVNNITGPTIVAADCLPYCVNVPALRDSRRSVAILRRAPSPVSTKNTNQPLQTHLQSEEALLSGLPQTPLEPLTPETPAQTRALAELPPPTSIPWFPRRRRPAFPTGDPSALPSRCTAREPGGPTVADPAQSAL